MAESLQERINNQIKEDKDLPKSLKTSFQKKLDEIDSATSKDVSDTRRQEAYHDLARGLTQVAAGMHGMAKGLAIDPKLQKPDWERRIDRIIGKGKEKKATATGLYKGEISSLRDRLLSKERVATTEFKEKKAGERAATTSGLQKERIALSKENLELQKKEIDRREKRDEQRINQYITGVVKDVRNDPIIKKQDAAIASAKTAADILEAGNPIGDATIGRFLARATGEVGNLAKHDVEGFGGSKALTTRLGQILSTWKDGSMTEENRGYVLKFSNLLKESAQKRRTDRLHRVAKESATGTITTEDILDRFGQELKAPKITKKEAPKDKVPMTAPDGRKLMVTPDKVKDMEAAGATRD